MRTWLPPTTLLPKAGLIGNSHMLMMDKNNLQVAALIQEWLAKQGLVR